MIADSWSKLPADGSTEVGLGESPRYKSGDFDKDGDVDVFDLGRLIQFFLTSESSVDIAPVDAPDGIVNLLDVAIIAKSWGKGTTIPLLPEAASNPNPVNGATNIDKNADLSWTAGEGATSYDVYFGTSSPPPLIGNQTAVTFEPGTMAASTKHYWQIDSVNGWGKTAGEEWIFYTAMPPPP
jgi:hypothetical protein